MNNLTYGASVTAKTGRRVPAFPDGKAMFSLYAPERDARVFAEQVGPETGFVVVAGVGDGSHIAALLERCPEARVLALEHSEENLLFLRREFDLCPLDRDPRVFLIPFTKPENLTAAILRQYMPVLHGGFALCFQEAWKRNHGADAEGIRCAVEATLEQVKGDMATQAAFGKLWMRNIFLNIRSNLRENDGGLPTKNARCIIVAAGPTMEEHLDELRGAATGGTALFAVDTAYPALLRRGIVPDGVVTIDAQALSAAHFVGTGGKAHTILFADLCCNPAIPRFFADQGQGVRFFVGNHPLCALANRFFGGCLPQSATQSGTVTLAALDLAVQLGFQHIRILGADFSYPHGKAYARGTYLDSRFYPTANRLAPGEQQYAALLCCSASVLDQYYEAAKKQIASYDVDILSDSARGLRSSQKSTKAKKHPRASFQVHFCSKDFLLWYREQLEAAFAAQDGKVSPEIVLSCLPLGAWAQKKQGKMKKNNVFDLLKLAYNLISRYN
jgi:hypothetical protein